MNRIELGDSIELIKTVADESVHLILSDIPFDIIICVKEKINAERWI